jgi:hypothetical protein
MTDLGKRIDAIDVPIKCGKSSRDLSRTIGEIRARPNIICSNCGPVTKVDHRDLDAKAQQGKRALSDFARNFSKTISSDRGSGAPGLRTRQPRAPNHGDLLGGS